MRIRLRTSWLEIGAGFHLLFAGVLAHELRDGVVPQGGFALPHAFGAVCMLLAACAVFLLHPAQAHRGARKALFVFAGTAAAIGALWFLSAGRTGVALLQFGYAIWLLAAGLLPWCDQRIWAVDETPRMGFKLIVGTALAAIGLYGFFSGAGGQWHATTMMAWSVATGAALIWVELSGTWKARLPAAVLASLAFLYHGASSIAGGGVGEGGIMLAAFSLLLLSSTIGSRLPEAADDLGGITPRQREIYVFERAGEMTLWAVAALSSVFINFIDGIDLRLYFAAILSVAFVTQYSYRLRPSASISERRYLLTLAAIVASSLVLISATGGALGPFVYLAYLAVFAGTVIIRPIWSMAVAVAYAGYVLAEFAWRVLAHQGTGGKAAQYLFLATTLIFTGIYTAWIGRRRARTDKELISANRQLAEALRTAVREREKYERQAQDLKELNEDLLEMRSALMNVLEDVEESKRQIETERRREVASFNALAEGVVAAGKDGRIFLCNPTAATILGIPAEKVIGQQIERAMRLFQEDGAVMQTRSFADAYSGRTVSLGERLRLTRADGSYVPVSGVAAPYLDEDERTAGIVVAFRDVTVEREIDRQKSDFISIASHQLRTPLSALRWFLDLLLAGDAGPLKPTQREYLSDMSASVTRMVKLVGDLLNISRIESGRIKPSPELMDTRVFVDSMVREFMPLVKQQEIAFTSDVAKSAKRFYADPSLARQAVSNVLSNAMKYTPPGGAVSLDVKVADNETVFKIKDTGLGIPRNQQYRVFDKFFRGENVVSRETVGSGLGLYFVKTVIDLSDGRIWFESEEKKGTTFFLAFPNGPKALPGGKDGGTISA